MKILYTYDTNNGKNTNIGFGDIADLFVCFKLSLQAVLDNGFTDIHINTDNYGYKVLNDMSQYIDELKDTQIHICDFPKLTKQYLWNMPKLWSYANADEPFLHIDIDLIIESDVYSKMKLNKPVYTEVFGNSNSYVETKNLVEEMCLKISSKHITSGCIGGYDIDIFKDLYNTAIDYVNNNKEEIEKDFPRSKAVFIEEILFTHLYNTKYKDFESCCELFSYKDVHTLKNMIGYKHFVNSYKRSSSGTSFLRRMFSKKYSLKEYKKLCEDIKSVNLI